MTFSEVQCQRCKQLFQQLFSKLSVPPFDCLYACQWFFAEMVHSRQDRLHLDRTLGKRDFLNFVLQDWQLVALCQQAYERSGGEAVQKGTPPAVSPSERALATPDATPEPPPLPPPLQQSRWTRRANAVAAATFRLCPIASSEVWGLTMQGVGETQEVINIDAQGELHRQLGTSLLHWRILSANGQTGAGIPAELKKKSLTITLEAAYMSQQSEVRREHAQTAQPTTEVAAALPSWSTDGQPTAAPACSLDAQWRWGEGLPPGPLPEGRWGSVTLDKGEFGSIHNNLVFHKQNNKNRRQ